MLGAGSSDILITAAMTFAGNGGRVVHSQYGFVVYGLAAQKLGADVTVVPATPGLGHDLDAMLAAACATPRRRRSSTSPTRAIRPAPS